MPIVSSSLAEALDAVVPAGQVQWIPVSVAGTTYQILNALRVVDAIDPNRSLYTRWEEGDGRPDRLDRYRMMVELRIIPAAAEGLDVFRLTDWEVPLIVSDVVRGASDAGGFSGADFTDVT